MRALEYDTEKGPNTALSNFKLLAADDLMLYTVTHCFCDHIAGGLTNREWLTSADYLCS